MVPSMSPTMRKVAWAIFWLFTILTQLASARLWMLASYELVLSALAIISAGLGLWILITNRFAWRSVILVVLGLIVGQWWLVESLTMMAFWSIRGFAP
jgi:hypothetical protein